MSAQIQVGDLVCSLAGHDAGDVLLVARQEGAYVWVCDGKRRKAPQGKKKKIKHVMALGKHCAWAAQHPERINNTSVRKAIRDCLAEEQPNAGR